MKISAGIIALAIKIGTKLLPTFAKVAKVGKTGLAIGAVTSYAYLFTWQFAIMLVILLFVHESGHIWAMKRCGMKTKGIYLLPFFGAVAVADDMFKSRKDEAYIAIMGPIWGFGISLATVGIYFITNDALFAAAAGWMALINLFNLLPISPLDGGRIVKSITFSLHTKIGFIFLAIGLVISTILMIWAGLILFIILLFIGSFEFLFEYKIRPNTIIKKLIKELDAMIKDCYNPLCRDTQCIEIRNALDKLKNILADEKEDISSKIKTLTSLRTDKDYYLSALSQPILAKLENYVPIPKMSTTNIISMTIVYIIVIAILWGLMAYMSHVPEVEIARQFFMS